MINQTENVFPQCYYKFWKKSHEQIIALASDDTADGLIKVLALVTLKRFSAAKELIGTINQTDYPVLYHDVSLALEVIEGKTAHLFDAASEILTKNGDSVIANLIIGKYYEMRPHRNLQRSLIHYTKANQVFSSNMNGYMATGRVLTELKQYQQAKQQFQKMVSDEVLHRNPPNKRQKYIQNQLRICLAWAYLQKPINLIGISLIVLMVASCIPKQMVYIAFSVSSMLSLLFSILSIRRKELMSFYLYSTFFVISMFTMVYRLAISAIMEH